MGDSKPGWVRPRSPVSRRGTHERHPFRHTSSANACIKAYATPGGSPPPGDDTTPPVTSVSGWDERWQDRDVKLTLTTVDEPGGSGVKSITGRFDDGEEQVVEGVKAIATIPAPQSHASDGQTKLTSYATEFAGNREAARSVTVKIDTRGPACAAKKATVRRGQKGSLYFAVRDALSPQVTCAISIKTLSGATRKTFSWGYDTQPGPDQWWYIDYRWTLKKGTYNVFVFGRDLAGNNAGSIGKARLVVR